MPALAPSRALCIAYPGIFGRVLPGELGTKVPDVRVRWRAEGGGEYRGV